MTYNILAINPGHNGSSALVCDGKLEVYIEEERMSRMKYDGNPFRSMMYIMERYHINELIIAGTGQESHRLPWTGEDSYTALVRKYYPKVKVTSIGHEHHLGHAASAFYNSGFDTAAAVIVDGCGSIHRIRLSMEDENAVAEAYETESIFECSYKSINPIFKRYGANHAPKINEPSLDLDGAVTTVKAYEGVSEYLGFGFIEAGKTMGLAPYGREDKNIPDLLYGESKRGDKNVFISNYPAGSFIDSERFEYLKRKSDPKEWHSDASKLTDAARNLAWKVQKETQEYVGDLIEKAVDMTGETNIVIAGGYGLNCVANYYFKERFPELNIFVDPVSHDGGTSIGLAKFFAYEYAKQNEIEYAKDPLETLYLGPQYEYEVEDLDFYKDIEVSDATDADIAKLIKERNIISIFQGRSEAGPRALGNRSIVYDPTDPDGKDFVNTVKGREWFRPFAGTVLQEHASEWFDLRGMNESPFMMYAVEMQSKKIGEVSAITHVDGTCRIQTVTKEQNENYYNLINEFYKLSGVPILFNTSFNLGGEPLVETLLDAIHTLRSSKLEYLYLPELGKLVKVENKEEEIKED
jgi:carbamoyltransferase